MNALLGAPWVLWLAVAVGSAVGGGPAAATGAIIGGGLGAVGGAATTPSPAPAPAYRDPYYRGY